MNRFVGVRHEGDLDTSEHNERLLIAVAQFVRERPKAGGDLVVAKTVSGQVSAVKRCVEEHLGRPILAPSGGAVLARVTRAMAYEDGPKGERKYLAPLRSEHFARLADPRCAFDCESPGWPVMRWALLLTMHQCLMRGGEPGRLPRGAFRPALGLCWCHFVWLAPASTAYATVRVKETGQLHWLLIVKVLSIKDTAAKFKRVPIPIASKHPTSHLLGDPLCPYSAVLASGARASTWCRPARAPPRPSSWPAGVDAVTTDEARDAIREAAAAPASTLTPSAAAPAAVAAPPTCATSWVTRRRSRSSSIVAAGTRTATSTTSMHALRGARRGERRSLERRPRALARGSAPGGCSRRVGSDHSLPRDASDSDSAARRPCGVGDLAHANAQLGHAPV